MQLLLTIPKGGVVSDNGYQAELDLLPSEVLTRIKIGLLLSETLVVSISELMGNYGFYQLFHGQESHALKQLYKKGLLLPIIYKDSLHYTDVIRNLPSIREKKGTKSHLSTAQERRHAELLCEYVSSVAILPQESDMRSIYSGRFRQKLSLEAIENCVYDDAKTAMMNLRSRFYSGETFTLSDTYDWIDVATQDVSLRKLFKKYFKFQQSLMSARMIDCTIGYDSSAFCFEVWNNPKALAGNDGLIDPRSSSEQFLALKFFVEEVGKFPLEEIIEKRDEEPARKMRRLFAHDSFAIGNTKAEFVDAAHATYRMFQNRSSLGGLVGLSDANNYLEIAGLVMAGASVYSISKGAALAGLVAIPLWKYFKGRHDLRRDLMLIYEQRTSILEKISNGLLVGPESDVAEKN